MNLVVNFLSMLSADEENGGVKRMLGVCAEFERIAKVVLDKAEKEGPRRKRKNPEEQRTKGPAQSSAATPQTPRVRNGPTPMASTISSFMANTMNSQEGVSPMDSNGSPGSGQWPNPDFPNGNGYLTPNNGMTPFSDVRYSNSMDTTPPSSMFDPNTFQQPFVPQDLWQMPMTLEWDLANMSGGAYSGFENGIVDDSGLHGNNHPM